MLLRSAQRLLPRQSLRSLRLQPSGWAQCPTGLAGHVRFCGDRVTVHVPLGSWSASEAQLTSWVDPFDIDTKTVEGALDCKDLEDFIENMECEPEEEEALVDALRELGVREVADLKLLKDDDIVSLGVKIVTARRLLGALTTNRSDTAPPPVPAKSATPGAFSAEDTMKFLAKKGITSGERSDLQVFCSSFLGGSLLGWGCCLTTIVAGGSAVALAHMPGMLQLLTGMVFPVGLSMVLLSGSELLTGNFVTMALPTWTHPGVEKQRVLLNTWRIWGISGTGNFAGSLFLACTVYSLGVVAPGTQAAAWLTALTVKKCSLALPVMVGKAACANWLVNVAIFQASSAHTTAGKIASLWFPIMTFVALGLEHSIANMFLLPLGYLVGADVSVLQILGNIGPVAVGNALGAIVFVAGVQRYSLLRNMVHR